MEYREDRTALLVYLGTQMAMAIEQLRQLNPDRRLDLVDRFLTWAKARD